MGVEGLTLDGLDLQAGSYLITEMHHSAAKKRPEWAEAVDGDGALLIRDPYFDNCQWDVTVEVQAASRDAAHTAVGLITNKLEEADRNVLGIPLVWTPADSTKSLTFYVLTGEINEIPITWDSGYFSSPPTLAVQLSLTCRPFGYGAEVGDLTDDFSVDTIGSGLWAFDTGAGTLSVSGGQLVPSSTAAKRLYRTDRRFYDAEGTFKMTTGAAATLQANYMFKRQGANDYLLAGWNATVMYVRKVVAGTSTNLVTAAFTPSAATSYWFRTRIQGNDIICDRFTSAPTPTSTPVQTVTCTLTGGDATQFGQGVSGESGLSLFPDATDWRYDDFSVAPNVFKAAGPLQIVGPIYGVTGDVPAEARLVVTDTASQNRDFAAWGLEWRYQAAADLLLTTPDLTITGFGGTSTTRAGSVSTNIFRGVLSTVPLAVCGTGNQPHVGTFRVYARLWATSLGIRARFTYRDGDGPLKSLEWETPPAEDGWVEVDLGVITIPPKLLGTQRWRGQVEAYTDTALDTLDVDLLILMPCGEGYGRARKLVQLETALAFAAQDSFDQVVSGGSDPLVGLTAPVGGVWAGAGAAADFVVEDTGHTAQRTSVSDAGPQFAISGLAASTTQVVQVNVMRTGNPPVGSTRVWGPVARYTDTSNYLRAGIIENIGLGASLCEVTKVVAGVATTLSFVAGGVPRQTEGAWFGFRLQVDAAGRFWFWYFDAGKFSVGPGTPTLSGQDSALATGGALASGKVGFRDANGAVTAATRNYNNFAAFVPVADAACFSGQSIEFRSDDTVRQDSTGTYWGNPKEYRGAPFFVPPAGDESRTSRVAVMLRRNDIATTSEANVTDNQAVQIPYTPRYLYLPR